MADAPTVTGLTVRPVIAPLARPLTVSSGQVHQAPLLLLDLATDAGATGRAYLFTYTPRALEPTRRLLEELSDLVVGHPLAPLELEARLHGVFRLLGAPGLAQMAMAGLDMAAWDALARTHDRPLAEMLGASVQEVAAYNSNGLGLIGAEALGREAEELLDGGRFRAVKLRLGNATVAEDLAALQAVRDAVGADTELFVDYNQILSVPEAVRRLSRIEEQDDIGWLEEPTRWDDYDGHAEVAAASLTPIQFGENCWGPRDMAKALDAGACNLFMADAMKIGGVSGWLRAAAVAETRGVPLSSHLFPEVSVHLMCASPTRHRLEVVDWASPVLRRPMPVERGRARPLDGPGIGLEWDEHAVQRYAV